MKRVIMSSKGLRKLYVVTYGWDDGNAEIGPRPGKGEDFMYAVSEEDACNKWEARNAKWIDGYEGCWAREATEEDLDVDVEVEELPFEDEIKYDRLGRYRKYYDDVQFESYKLNPSEYELYLDDIGQVYGYDFIGYVDAKPEYRDIFGDYAEAVVYADRYGNLRVCQIVNDQLFEIDINELEDLIDEYM